MDIPRRSDSWYHAEAEKLTTRTAARGRHGNCGDGQTWSKMCGGWPLERHFNESTTYRGIQNQAGVFDVSISSNVIVLCCMARPRCVVIILLSSRCSLVWSNKRQQDWQEGWRKVPPHSGSRKADINGRVNRLPFFPIHQNIGKCEKCCNT